MEGTVTITTKEYLDLYLAKEAWDSDKVLYTTYHPLDGIWHGYKMKQKCFEELQTLVGNDVKYIEEFRDERSRLMGRVYRYESMSILDFIKYKYGKWKTK